MTVLTDIDIDNLIGARNRITDVRDELIDYRAVAHIDAVLSKVPDGARNDVDLLLGRMCAKLIKPGWFPRGGVTAADIAQADKQEAKFRDAQDIDIMALLDAHNAAAVERRERMGEDYWDRRRKQEPIMSAAPVGNYAAGCGMGGND